MANRPASPRPRLAMIGFSVASAVVLAAGGTALLTQSCAEPPPAKDPTTQPDMTPPLPSTTEGATSAALPSAPVPPPQPPIAPPVT